MPPSTLSVSRLEDLPALRRSRTGARVEIALPGLDEKRRTVLQRRIERSLAACGCNEGSVAGFLYLLTVAVLLFAGRGPGSLLGWLGAGAGLIGALVAGKIAGLILARITLSRALRELERALRG